MSNLGFYIDDSEKQFLKSEKKEVLASTQSGKVHWGAKNSLYLQDLPLRVYRVLIKYPLSSSQINYEITAQGRGTAQNITRIRFQKDRFFVNGHSPDRVADELAILTTRALYPLELHIDYNTRKQKIINRKEIQNNWNKLVPYLEREYGGALLELYKHTIEEQLADDRRFRKSLFSNDLFFSLYCHSLYGEYSSDLDRESSLWFNIGEYNRPLLFKGKQWVEKEYNQVGGVFLHFHGQAISAGVRYELEVEYNLEKQRFTIKDILATLFRIKEGHKEPLTEVSIWQQREKEPVIDYEKQYEEERKKLDEDEVAYQKYLKNKGKGWFDRLFGF